MLDLTYGLKNHNETSDDSFNHFLVIFEKKKAEFSTTLLRKWKEVLSSKFHFTNNNALRFRCVTWRTWKSIMILDYNQNQRCSIHFRQVADYVTCRRQAKRIPTDIFLNLISFSAFVLCCEMNLTWNVGKLTKRLIFF